MYAFFGDPKSREYGDRWWDSDSLYEKKDANGVSITFAIHPIYKDVRVTLSSHDNTIYDWHAMAVLDVIYIEEVKRTILKILITENDWMVIQTDPTISIERHTKNESLI